MIRGAIIIFIFFFLFIYYKYRNTDIEIASLLYLSASDIQIPGLVCPKSNFENLDGSPNSNKVINVKTGVKKSIQQFQGHDKLHL